MPDEKVDIFDENNGSLSYSVMKSEAHDKSLWHRCVHINVYNPQGEILLQLRSQNKEVYPNAWDLAATGHVAAGEEPEISALRELAEEVGIVAQKNDLEFIRIGNDDFMSGDQYIKEINYLYFLRFVGDIQCLKIQKEEVEKIQFFSEQELNKLITDSPEKLAQTPEYFGEMFLRLKNIL